MSIETVQKMSRVEKLRLMELLWEDLSRSEEQFESPVWHGDALAETEADIAKGKEKILDWDEAKKELRRRFE